MIQTLIDKQDTFEIIRDKIGQILADEVESQMALAITAGKNPDLWKMHIFTERSNPWEQWLNIGEEQYDATPIINVSFDKAAFDPAGSNTHERQKTEGTFNVDCYGYGRSGDDGATGHKAGDEEAALQAQHAVRLVRNILMASIYNYLDLRGIIGRRWLNSVTMFPPADDKSIQKIVAARLVFGIVYNEFSPQYEGEELEIVRADINRKSTGEILTATQWNYQQQQEENT